MLGHPRCGVHPKGDNGNIVVEAYNRINLKLNGLSEDHGPGVIPEEELDHEGNVSEDLYISARQESEPSPGGDPHRANENP